MIIIGEKINGSIPSIAEAIKIKDEQCIKKLAKAQADAGVTYIDICASVSQDIEVETMQWLINLVQEVTDIPIAVDSPSVNVCLECLKFCKKPGLFNSVSMEGDKTDVAFPALAKMEWEIVALLNDNNGIPQTAERRLEIFRNLMNKAKQYNIDPSRFHIDPLIEMLCTSENGIRTVTDVIHAIKKEYPAIHITGAISNISFNLPARKLVNQGFVVLAMNAGMDSAIFDPLNKDMMGMIYAAEALLGRDEYCMEYINGYRKKFYG